MASDTIRIGILGGSGYGGAELLRILLLHPQAEPVFVTANEHAGKSVAEVHRNLYGLTDLKFRSASEGPAALEDLEGAVLCLRSTTHQCEHCGKVRLERWHMQVREQRGSR